MKNLTDEALAIAIPTAFPALFPNVYKHKWSNGTCVKCQCNIGSNDLLSDCEVITNIDVTDANVAMKVRDAARESKAWINATYEVWESYTGKAVTQKAFWRDFATPKAYFRAALLTKGAE